MIRFLYTLAIISAFGSNIYSQNQGEGKQLYINSTIGFATLEIDDAIKLNAASKEFFIGIDVLRIKESMVVYSGLEYTNLSGNYFNSGSNTYISNNYLSLPVTLRYKKRGSNNLDFYIDVGMYGSYLLNAETEVLAQSVSENSIGYSFGLLAGIGASYKFDETWRFTIGFKSKAEYLNNIKDNASEYKVRDLYAINLGFNISL